MHGLSPDDEIDYWRERAQKAEREIETLRREHDEARSIARSAAHMAKAYIGVCDDLADEEEVQDDLGQMQRWIDWANEHRPRKVGSND